MSARSPPSKVSRREEKPTVTVRRPPKAIESPSQKPDTEDTVGELVRRLDSLRAKGNPPPSHSAKGTPSPARSNSTKSIESLHTAMPEASTRKIFSSSSGPTTPRYGPLSVSSASAPDQNVAPQEDPQERECRHAQRKLDVMEVVSLWRKLGDPTIGSGIFLEAAFPEEIPMMMRRGSKFAHLAPVIGVNAAAKRARKIDCRNKKSF